MKLKKKIGKTLCEVFGFPPSLSEVEINANYSFPSLQFLEETKPITATAVKLMQAHAKEQIALQWRTFQAEYDYLQMLTEWRIFEDRVMEELARSLNR